MLIHTFQPLQALPQTGCTLGGDRMRTGFVSACLFAVFVSTLPALGQPARPTEVIDGREVAAGEALVQFRAGRGYDSRGYIARAHNIQAARALTSGGLMHLRSASEPAAQLVRALAADPDVVYAEPNYIVHTQASGTSMPPNDTFFAQQWALQNMGQTGGKP